jgi:hypothetical protein
MRKFLLPALAVLLVLQSGSARDVNMFSWSGPGASQGEVFLLVLLEADAFLCSPCFDRVLAFCRSLPAENDGVHLGAVILCRNRKKEWDEAEYRRMIGRRAKSVFQANRIICSLVIDEAQNWSAFTAQGAGLLVIDGRTQTVRSFPLPLEPSVLRTILPKTDKGGDSHD